MIGIQEDDKDAGPGLGGDLPAVSDPVGLDARLLRAGRTNLHVLECLDLLRRAVLDELDLFGAKIGERLPILRRVHVDANEVGAPTEGGLLCRQSGSGGDQE